MDEKAIILKERLNRDKFAISCGIEIEELCADYVLCKVELREDHLNANGVGHGGLLFALADFAFGVHANYLFKNAVTQRGSITYLAPALYTSHVYARSRFIAKEKHSCVFTVEISDDHGKILSVANFDGFVK